MTRFALAAAWLLVTCHSAHAQSLVAEGAKVEKLAGDFKFTEGPVSDAFGNIFFSDIPNNRIHKWSADGKLSTFREDSGGANGLAFDKAGYLLCCEGGARRVTAVSPDGKVFVLAEQYEGKKLNSPNDLWIDPRGGVYFTDPRYGNRDGLEQDGFHVYYISPDGKQVLRVADDLKMPNGIVGTADGKRLYVADAGDRKTYSYNIGEDGRLSDKTLFCESGSDGMKLDEKGNVYLTAGGIRIYDPSGKLLETIEVPEGPANLCFGGKERDTLFITARTSFYSVKMRVKGPPTAQK